MPGSLTSLTVIYFGSRIPCFPSPFFEHAPVSSNSSAQLERYIPFPSAV